jgi:hypothetical protein
MSLLPERLVGLTGQGSEGGNHEPSSFLFARLDAPDFVPAVGHNIHELQ